MQKSVIIGSILGDGYLRIVPGRSDAFLETNHSIKAKEYVWWKYSVLQNICRTAPKERIIDDRRTAFRFFTRQHAEITLMFSEYYDNGRKIIPDSLVLDPVSLAVWYMDDGSKCRDCDVYLNCQQFSLNDQKKLIVKLRKLGIKARLNRDKKYYRIRILKESLKAFFDIIEPHIIDSMRYKLVPKRTDCD